MRTLVTIFFVAYPLLAWGQFNMTEYRKMPPLYSFDDYDACLQTETSSSYCLVITEVVPNVTSNLWNQIANFSADSKRHFRHDSLFFGVCVNQCEKLLDNVSSLQKEQLYTGNIENTEVVEFFTYVNKRMSDNRILYEKVINTCLNYKFRSQYGLQLRSFIEYCDNNEDPKPYDFMDITFLVVLGTILLLAVVCSCYDRQLRNKDCMSLHGNEFYKQKLHTQRDTLLTSFSIYRNYYRFVEPSRSELANDLRFFEGYRFIATFLVVLAHVLLVIKSVPVVNPDFIEKIFHNIATNIVINGHVIIQLFFVMSSFLLCLGFQKNLASKKPGLQEWFNIISYRYLRLMPAVGLMIHLNASVLPRLQNGPFWRQIIEEEYVFCRETWWRNLLLINNFTLRKSCIQQTWYIAADFQLYMILAGVLIFVARFPKTRTFVAIAGIVVSFLTTGLVTYFRKLDAIHQENPESYRFFFWTNSDTFYESYTPFYTNLGGFVFGAITAMIYLKYKDQEKNFKKYKTKLNIMIVFSIPILCLILLSGDIFYRFKFTKPSIWIGLYASLFRNIWAIISCVILILMSFKLGTILYKFTAIKIFVPLGRLSYQVYLVHSLVLRCVIGSVRHPLYMNQMQLVTYTLATVVMSFAAAFVLYIFLELPLTTILNLSTKTTKRRRNVPSTIPDLEAKKETSDIPVDS